MQLQRNSMLMAYNMVGEAKPIISEIRHDPNNSDVISFDVDVIKLDTPSRNNVVYVKEAFINAITKDPITVDKIKRGCLYGEWDHPDDPTDIKRWSKVHMPNSSHKFTRLWYDEPSNTIKGTVQTWTGGDNLLYKAIMCGELPAFSIRVLGESTKRPDGGVVLDPIILIAIDWVRYPGNPSSYVSSSDVFNYEEAPAVKGFSMADRSVALTYGESNEIISLPEDSQLVSLGEGFYRVMDTIDDEDEKQMNNLRANCFY